MSSRRKLSAEQRRADILKAALTLFCEQGFQATRMEDVAKAAGIAKGTLYLHFADKEGLFEELLRTVAEPSVQHINTLAVDDHAPAAEVLGQILEFQQTQALNPERLKVMRLLLSEGHRFPRVTKFYHQKVISKNRDAIRKLIKRGIERGEFSSDALYRFPQLLFAPIMMAAIWNSLFGDFDPLDVDAFFAEHRKLVLTNHDKE